VTDDGTSQTFGASEYRSTGAATPAGWRVTVSIAPIRLELSLEIASDGGEWYSLEELHQLECGAPLPARQTGLYEAARDAALLGNEFERLAEALRQ
jgi:hypothetical protein